MRKKRAFKVKYKTFFIIFKGLSVAKTHLRPESALLSRFGFSFLKSKWRLKKHTSNLNFNVQLSWKSKYHLVLCFMSQLQHRNENQNFLISHSILSKKQNDTLGTRILTDWVWDSQICNYSLVPPQKIQTALNLADFT